MNAKKFFIILGLILALSLTVGAVLAEDGLMFRRNISKTPDAETEKAGLFMMDFYVPAQASTGEVITIDNYLMADDATAAYEARDFAKPLVTVYIDDTGGHEEMFLEESIEAVQGGISFGEFDAYVGISLDDGTTWKTTNLSRSADQSSFILTDGEVYPGDVHNVVHQVFGDNIMVVWASKYCEGGTPLFSLDPAVETDYFADLEDVYGKDAVYLYDLFGVAGTQGSVDYALQGFPEIGEIPFSCIWSARGKLLAADDPSTDTVETIHVAWTKPERLSSGVRDANLPAVDCGAGAGCFVTWQEDPEGLRPGLGLGPGEGWSGAVAWQQTDVWSSFITLADFDIVFADDALDTATEMTLYDYTVAGNEELPKPYVPMAMPVRLTDNAMCKAEKSDPYCYIDFDAIDAIDPLALPIAPTADSDFCATQLEWENPGGTTLNLCVTEDDRLLNGRVASTRVRMNVKPYTKADGTKSAWVIMGTEENKALGEVLLDGTEDPIDIGKEMWYYTFDLSNRPIVEQGLMLTQPAQCKFDGAVADPLCTGLDEGAFFPVQFDERGNEYWLTEISRRFALTTNSVQAAVDAESGLSAVLIYKQGIINQGGPADILLRMTRIVDDATFDPTVDNPYGYEYIDCDEWLYLDGSNPNYLHGLCKSPAVNITGTTIVECDSGTGNDACADTFPVNDDGSNTSEGDFPKVFEWRNCDGSSVAGCEDDYDLDDQSWENPFDVAKGHRGFLDGDFVMMMYAWSPNWNANAVGNDHYNLYTRRSFDGGLTWTTTPAALGGAGTTWSEYYYAGTPGTPEEYVWSFGAGEFEQARNVSLLTGNKITILDPRYSPTGGLKLYPTIRTDWLTANELSFEGLPYDDDLARDQSKFFMIYETGDNTTVAVGEATPLNLYYSRATVYGDTWETMEYVNQDELDLVPRWPWMENKDEILSGEAAMLANPGGTFMYAVWNQWEEEVTTYVDEYNIEHHVEHVYNSDMPFRRTMWLPDDYTAEIDPVAEFLYTGPTIYSIEAEDVVTLIVSARDLDKVGDGAGIVEYSWLVQVSDHTVDLTQFAGCYKDEPVCKVPVRILQGAWDGFGNSGNPGAWSASVKVTDNDGQSREIFAEPFFIWPTIRTINMPLVVR